MEVFREFVKINNDKLILHLPKDFENKEVEIIIVPKNYNFWREKEIKNSGKIGFMSQTFEKDDEEYSKW